ncbi:MAG TPA: transcription termination/antitermination protein NusG [Armatimonadota bacterium]|nr:transcription termination/antitermination protein NusG [Armatimonadota bacterium]
MEKSWYAVHTYSGQEHKVKANLDRRVQAMGLGDRIFRVLVPTQEEYEVRGGKKRSTKRKIFPGYVLIEMVYDPEVWHVVRETTGVTGFISSGDMPVPLQNQEIAEILGALEGEKPKPRISYIKGDTVRVISGPFSESIGKVDEVNLAKEKLRVMISIFGRETPVELDFVQIEKIA